MSLVSCLMVLFSIFPIVGHQQEKNRKYFQTADEHVGAHEPFASRRNDCKGAGRACCSCCRADIAQHADATAQCRIDICPKQRLARHRYHH